MYATKCVLIFLPSKDFFLDQQPRVYLVHIPRVGEAITLPDIGAAKCGGMSFFVHFVHYQYVSNSLNQDTLILEHVKIYLSLESIKA